MFHSKENSIIKSVFVLGSSSEIAYHICIELAKKGCKTFHLLARDFNKNKKLVNFLKNNFQVKITEEIFDLFILENQIPKVENFDLYLITAGMIGDSNLASNNILELMNITSANYSGILRWIIAIASPNRLDKDSRLWIFSSVAGDIGRPSNYQYGAAKAALTIFSEGILNKCFKKAFKVRIFKAGYIKTRMSYGKANPLLSLSPNKLAKIIIRNPNRRGIEYLPWWWFIIMLLVKFLPKSIISKI